MASSSKTANLGLNNWSDNDRPKRSDFVNDNSIIDSKLGGHIKNNQIHLSTADREKLDTATAVYQYQGDGTESRSLTLPFEPSFAVVYKKGEAPVSYNTLGYCTVSAAFAAPSGNISGGVTLTGTSLTVKQSASASSGVSYNLNKQYSQYIVFLIH